MAKTKEFEDKSIMLSAFAKALGHPARIAILRTIAMKGGEVKGETIEVSSLAPATVFQHLRELKKAGIINGRLFGKRSHYQINWEFLKKNLISFEHFSEFLKENYTDPSSS
ncbi:MAG: ArsR family transcriptional regulator [Flavobacteriales bacterium]|jgi:ArsR family transcriptional regulator